MKTFIYALTAFVALAGVALAQTPPAVADAPTVQSTADDANRIISALQEQRNSALDSAAGAKALAAKANAEVDKLRAEVSQMRVKAVTDKAAPAAEAPKDGGK